jgi:hypothetical protein
MGVSFVRPSISELCFLLYSRPLHPELFDAHRQQLIQRDDYQALIRITDTGHAVSWQHEDVWLTELVTTPDSPLPKKRRLLTCRLRGERSETMQCGAGVVYQTSFTVERLEREIFARMQLEHEHDAQARGISHHFQAPHRLAASPLSHIAAEARARSLLVHTFHTFPDECAIVKSQSLFEFRR